MSAFRHHESLFRDPVHDLIDFNCADRCEALLVRLVDTAEFQRLRRIKQLGMAFMAYPGAEHSRFGHSLGAAYMARRILGELKKDAVIDPDEAFVCICAALIHDIGHGPYSHIFERFCGGSHEERAVEIALSPESEVHSQLVDFAFDLPDRVVALLRAEEPKSPYASLIASQLDADRMDYLIRDSLMTGVKYGIYDVERLIKMLRFDRENHRIGLSAKGLMPFEKYLQSRYHMYRQVYFHKAVTAAEVMLASLLRRAGALAVKGDLPGAEDPDSHLALLLLRPGSLSMSEYQDLDDAELISHIKVWARAEDGILSDLAGRLLRRRLFKSIDVSHIEDPLDERLERGRSAIEEAGLDPAHYFLRVESSDTPYRPYDPRQGIHGGSIYIEDRSGGWRDVEAVSPTISAFSHSAYTLTRIVFPESGGAIDLRERMLKIFR